MVLSIYKKTIYILISAVLFLSPVFISAKPVTASAQGYMKISPGGDFLVQIRQENGGSIVEVYETPQMKPVSRWKLPRTRIHTIEFSPASPRELLLSGSDNLFVYRFDKKPPESIFLHSGNKDGKIVQAGFSPDGKKVIWATSKSLNSSHLKSNEIITKQFPDKTISSFAPLRGQKVAVSFKNESTILLVDPYKKSGKLKVLPKEHNHEIVGMRSPDGKSLFSLDKEAELIRWDTDKGKALKKLKLPKQPDQAALGLSLDDHKESLVIMTGNSKGKSNASKFDIEMLSEKSQPKGIQKKYSLTPSGEMYSPIQPNRREAFNKKQIDELLEKFTPEEKTNFYELAKIEFESGQYDKSLEFIEKVSINSKQYKASRQLKKKIQQVRKQDIEIKAIEEEYRKGHYSSAKVLTEGVLAKDPEQPVAKKYADLISSKELKALLLKWFLFFISLILSILLGWLSFPAIKAFFKKKKDKKQPTSKTERKQTYRKDKTVPPSDTDKKEFIKQLHRLKSTLQTAIAADGSRLLEQNWISLEAEMNLVVRQAKRADANFIHLINQLKELTEIIEGLHSQQKKDQARKQAKEPEYEESKNYYELLEVSRIATQDEIKVAFRKQMQAYHPDKHQGADYDWIKEESLRMTKKIQEAYDTLSDLNSRMKYNEKLRIREEK